jgi:hypothetical protein
MPLQEATAHDIRPARPDYKGHRFEDAFDTVELRRKLGGAFVELIEFHSELEEDLDPAVITGLIERDGNAHQAARSTGNLLFYHADDGLINLNACGWNEKGAGRSALHTPEHREAVSYAMGHQVYKSVNIYISTVTLNQQDGYDFELQRHMTLDDVTAHYNAQA